MTPPRLVRPQCPRPVLICACGAREPSCCCGQSHPEVGVLCVVCRLRLLTCDQPIILCACGAQTATCACYKAHPRRVSTLACGVCTLTNGVPVIDDSPLPRIRRHPYAFD